jgi:hypothetical protein
VPASAGARHMPKKEVGEPHATELQTLNFKVPDAFKRSYKVYAAQRGMTMLDLLKEGFELSRKADGK